MIGSALRPPSTRTICPSSMDIRRLKLLLPFPSRIRPVNLNGAWPTRLPPHKACWPLRPRHQDSRRSLATRRRHLEMDLISCLPCRLPRLLQALLPTASQALSLRRLSPAARQHRVPTAKKRRTDSILMPNSFPLSTTHPMLPLAPPTPALTVTSKRQRVASQGMTIKSIFFISQSYFLPNSILINLILICFNLKSIKPRDLINWPNIPHDLFPWFSMMSFLYQQWNQ